MELVIVESPTKAKTLSKFLGKNYVVEASMGHVMDLPKKKLGIAVDKDFKPEYEPNLKSKKVLANLRTKALEASKVYLATDPDREGEAIAWHVLTAISDNGKKGKAKDTKPVNAERVVFHEITKEAVTDAFSHPRSLDMNLVDAQQARRVLDRIVGYKLSPLLWKKVRYGLSAGRVQSVAVRLIVEREEERKKFKPDEYWSLDALFENSEKLTFLAALIEVDGKKFEVKTEQAMQALVARVEKLKTDKVNVTKVERTEKKRNTYPPFTTSTLQQAASNRLGFSAKRTMSAAQKLFEAGFITYHRTDSLSLSQTFIDTARNMVKIQFGKDFLPESPNYYKTRSRNAQEAHEAIRPTEASLMSLKGQHTEDEKKVYQLIWQRALASQMMPMIYDQTSVWLNGVDKGLVFKATGSIVKFEGWMKVYARNGDDEQNGDDGKALPELKEGEKVSLIELKPEQHFTEPPPRFTEASLIKALEEEGIGRPSTYAPTISTIEGRGYVKKEGKYFIPEDVAVVVNRLLTEHFPEIVDVGFTASLEEDLDKISNGEEKWIPVIKKFYTPFSKSVEDKDSTLNKKDFTLIEETEEKCPDCGKHLNIKLGKFGRFLSCSGFPDCKFAKPIVDPNAPPVDESQLGKCPECETGVLSLRSGRFGKFIACGNYPKCKFTKPYLDKVGIKCPKCNEGDVIRKKGKFKRIFYGCSRYPDCDYSSTKDPLKVENLSKETQLP